MAAFDKIVGGNTNFKGYTGTPPTTEEEYLVMDCWVDALIAPAWSIISTGMVDETVRASRKAGYDKLNQDEMRYDDLINNTTTWQDAIAEIKLDIPKG